MENEDVNLFGELQRKPELRKAIAKEGTGDIDVVIYRTDGDNGPEFYTRYRRVSRTTALRLKARFLSYGMSVVFEIGGLKETYEVNKKGAA